MSLKADPNWRLARDSKLVRMLDPDEPAWLVGEEMHEEDEIVVFTVVHRWGPDGWSRRRYSYDFVSDVLHFRGASPVSDSELAAMKAEQRLKLAPPRDALAGRSR